MVRRSEDVVAVPPLDFGVWTGRTHGMARAHKHADIEVNHVRQGMIAYVLAGQRVQLHAGEVGLFWASAPHQMTQLTEDVELGWAVLPLPMLRRWGASDEMLSQLWGGALLVDREAEEADKARWRQWESQLRRRDAHAPRWRRVVELELEARLLRLMLRGPRVRGGASAGESASARGGSSAVEQMAAYLSDHFAQPVQVADVAAHVHLHPAYAMRQFRKVMGMTMVEYLTRQRVAEARRLLMSTDRTVLAIAMDSGFGSLSQFHAVFRRAAGQTPAAFRRAMRSG